jgi:hypothetical protein
MELSQKELQRVKVIENAVEGRLTVGQAGELLGLSGRQVKRLKAKYEPKGVDWEFLYDIFSMRQLSILLDGDQYGFGRNRHHPSSFFLFLLNPAGRGLHPLRSSMYIRRLISRVDIELGTRPSNHAIMHSKRIVVLAAVGLALSVVAMGQTCGVATATSANASNFNGTPIDGGNYIWFNANFKASGVPSTGATIYLTLSSISFTADQSYTVQVPNAQVVFDPNAVCASTTFDTATNTWKTTVPLSGTDDIFLSGVAFPVPSTFSNAGGLVKGPVVWQGTLGDNTSGITISWKWGAAVYTNFTSDYNLLSVKPAHSKVCAYNNGDQAGTPEGINPSTGRPFKDAVTGGARGGGGSNWTGSWSGTVNVTPSCPIILLQ